MKYTRFNNIPYEAHRLIYDKIENGSNVLDVGCATGYFAKKLKEKKCNVWGIEIDSSASQKAKKYCEKVFVGDIEKEKSLPFQKHFFDYILLMDILEHLKNPSSALRIFKPYLKKDGKIIISVPNVAFLSIRLALLRGKFAYQELGIMDATHLRFFTKKTLLEMIEKTGLRIEEVDVSSGFSQITFVGKYLNHIPKIWQYKITKLFPTLLGYQFIIICTVR